MDIFTVTFPVSGVHTLFFIPPLFSFILSFFTSMGGVTGAVLILPFQLSFLGYTAPSVSSTNLLYNIVSTPGGIWRFIREGRMNWPLAAIITAGTMPGILVGYYFRVMYLPDTNSFKLFVGLVVMALGIRLIQSTAGRKEKATPQIPASFTIENVSYGLSRVSYDFSGTRISFSTPGMFILSLIVGVIGGTYGIGGGAIIAPFCVTIFNLPVYTIAGATIMGTLASSVFGVLFYSLIPIKGAVSQPDWLLGLSFGIGGFAGMYLGAKSQKHFSEKWIKIIVGIVFLLVALSYIVQYFMK